MSILPGLLVKLRVSQQKGKKGPKNLAPSGPTNSENANDLWQHCLNNSVVLRVIFSQLPQSDLLSCRLVNKLWYSEINSFMLTSDNDLRISSDQPFQQVQQLIQLIPQMSLPFNGLNFQKEAGQSAGCENREITSDLVSKFLRVLPPIKHLHFDGSLASKELVIKLMLANCDNLEKVSFDNSVQLPTEIMQTTYELRRLKTIAPKKSSQFPRFPGCTGNVHTIILRCTSVELVEDYTFNDIFEVAKGREHLVKNLSLDSYSIWLPLVRYANFLKTEPRLKSLTLTLKACRTPPAVLSIIPDLVQLSKETMTSIEFSPYIWGLVARGRLQFEPLPRIQELQRVSVNFSRMELGQISNFGGFILHKFPNLKSIEVENVDFEDGLGEGWMYVNVFCYWNGYWNGIGTLTSSSVTSLKFVECQPLQVSLSAVIHAAFPNVTNLNVSLRECKLQSVYDLWGNGPDLKSLTISSKVKSRLEMESELLGIFPEEARLLREMKLSPTELSELQIVPIRPALHHLTGLVALSIKISLERTGILLLQWNGEEARYANEFDHNEIIKALSLGRMKSLKNPAEF